MGKNWFNNRGTTNHFVKEVQVLDKNPIANAFNGITKQSPGTSGKVIDTIYVVIQPEKK